MSVFYCSVYSAFCCPHLAVNQLMQVEEKGSNQPFKPISAIRGLTSDIVGISVPVCVYGQPGQQYVCLHVYKSLHKWGCSLVSHATNSSAHTWLHSSTFRHCDESHAPFLHFCSHSVLLGRSGSHLSVSHTYTQGAQLSLCRQQKIHIVKRKRHVLNVFVFPRCPSQMCLCLILTLNFGKVGELSSNLFMSTVCSPGLCVTSAKLSQCILIKWLPLNRWHRSWACNEPRGDEWRREEKGAKQRSSVWK